jgi:hypothetical protein
VKKCKSETQDDELICDDDAPVPHVCLSLTPIILPSCISPKSAVASRRVTGAATKTCLSFTTVSSQSSVHRSFSSKPLPFVAFTRATSTSTRLPSLLFEYSVLVGPSTPRSIACSFALATMTTEADDDNDNQEEAATSQLPSTTAADVESSTNSTTKQQEQQADGTETKPDSASDIVDDELAQAVGKIHVTDDKVEPEEMPEALRKVASWIMDGTVKNILVLTGAGVRCV